MAMRMIKSLGIQVLHLVTALVTGYFLFSIVESSSSLLPWHNPTGDLSDQLGELIFNFFLILVPVTTGVYLVLRKLRKNNSSKYWLVVTALIVIPLTVTLVEQSFQEGKHYSCDEYIPCN